MDPRTHNRPSPNNATPPIATEPSAAADMGHAPATPPAALSRRAKRWGAVVALLVLAGTGWLAWHLTHPASGAGGAPGMGRRGAPATTVGVARAESAQLPVLLNALGTVTPQASVRVRPQVSGVLEKVLFKEGQLVRAGDLLATIDARQFELALQQSSGQRQRDEAQLESARVTLQRYQTLLGQDSIARQEVDSQAALVKQLEGSINVSRAAEGTARLNLAHTRVLAPMAGRIGLRLVDVGNVVSTSDVNGIALLTQVSPVDVVFAVPQDQASELQQLASQNQAMPVLALDRTRSQTLDKGTFASLDNQVDVQTGTVKAKAHFANTAQTLLANQFVNVQLTLKTLPNAVLIPVAALRHGGNGDFVYVLNADSSTVSLRPVTRGATSADRVAIAAGLEAGEQVITEGADRLEDGARVVLPGAKPSLPGEAGARPGARGGKRPRPSGVPGAPASAASAASAAALPSGAVSSAPQSAASATRPASAP